MPEAWGVLLEEGGRGLLHKLSGDAVTVQEFADVAEARLAAPIGDERLIWLGGAEMPPPAPILPETIAAPFAAWGALRQAMPAAILPPAARIVIAGALRHQPDWDGVICLPCGDVTHWVHVSAREIVSFQGGLTGRLAAVFAAGSAFDEAALSDTMARPERLAAQLNAASVAGDPAAALGHLLGAELAAMRAYWLGQDVLIIGADAPYAAVLRLQGVAAGTVPYAQAWRDGLWALGAAAGFAD